MTQNCWRLCRSERCVPAGELAKYHFLGGGQLRLSLDERVAACVRIKAEVVVSDEREGGGRALLNYGHTLAHALEIEGFDLRHGEAVAIGIEYAAMLAHEMGRIDARWRNIAALCTMVYPAVYLLDRTQTES